jgi:ATP-dependent DNA helicase RecG
VQVSLLSDRLVITSPGGLYGTVTSESLGTPGYSSARNQFLLSLLENVPFSDGYLVENRKAGYRLICDELQHAGMPAPKADDHISSFEITLFRSGALPQAEELSDEVLNYLATVSDASATEIADATGLSRRTVTYRLSRFVESGMVLRVGKPRSPKQRYRLP